MRWISSLGSIAFLSVLSRLDRGRPKFTRLHQQSDQAGNHERCTPYQVDIEPRLAESREAKLAINRPCYQPCDCKVGSCMDHRGKQSGEWACGCGCVVVTCHLVSRLDRPAA